MPLSEQGWLTGKFGINWWSRSRSGSTRPMLAPTTEGAPLRVISWGGRIRTSDWLIQNQLPYRLATPQ